MKVAGFGFRASATQASFVAALNLVGGVAGLDALATAEDKVGAPPLRGLSTRLNLPLVAIPNDQIAEAPATLTPRAPHRYGGRSLAEAAALIGAGRGARLIAGRCVSPDGKVVVAIAEGLGQ